MVMASSISTYAISVALHVETIDKYRHIQPGFSVLYDHDCSLALQIAWAFCTWGRKGEERVDMLFFQGRFPSQRFGQNVMLKEFQKLVQIYPMGFEPLHIV